MKFRVLLLFVVAVALSGTATYAHHSFGATYDVKKEVKIQGKIVVFAFRNPHSFVHIEAPDTHGMPQRWAVEWSGAAALGNQGVNRETLRVGDEVIVTARPSRVAGEYRAQMLTLKRPSDGLTWGTRTGEVVD